MLEEMVKNVMSKQISSEFQHLQLPAIMHARITGVVALGDWYEYILKILDKNGEIDERYPEIPKVRSKMQVESGKLVVIGLLYGELNPYIIGEVV